MKMLRRSPRNHLSIFMLCLLLASPVSAAKPDDPSAVVDMAKTVEAAFKGAVSVYRQGNYQEAFRDFGQLARAGHADAQYYLAIMYAAGQGVPQDYGQAYKWLSCVADGARDGDLRFDAAQQRVEVRKKLSFEAITRARRSAETECLNKDVATQEKEKGEEIAFSPFRGKLLDKLAFFAGDMIMLGVLVLAHATGATWAQELSLSIYKYYGDWFIGLISLFWWLLFARIGYLVFQAISNLRSRNSPGKADLHFVPDEFRKGRGEP